MIGFVADEDLATLYASADLFVLPTLTLEGFGLVTVEALACGTPVIGTPVGATPEILTLLDPRLVAADTTPTGLTNAVIGFLHGSWSQHLTPDRVSKFVHERYDWNTHVDRTEQIYSELLR
jgi:glycosyltransferase involved in cell wall biosynthesis